MTYRRRRNPWAQKTKQREKKEAQAKEAEYQESLGAETVIPDVNSDNPAKRYNLGEGATPRMIDDYRNRENPQANFEGRMYGGTHGRSSRRKKIYEERNALNWAKSMNKQDTIAHAEKAPRRSAMKYVAPKLPSIRSRGFSNRGMRSIGGTLG